MSISFQGHAGKDSMDSYHDPRIADGSAGEASGPVAARRPYRPPIGIPTPKENRWTGILASIALHLLIVLLLVAPWFVSAALAPPSEGAGGPGPAGGGGGGRGGTGGIRTEERLHYIQVAPPAAPTTTPPVLPPLTPPVVPPVTPPTAVVPPKIDIKTDLPTTKVDFAISAGSGGGAGRDGTTGSGPGSGGGEGSGVGTGRGTGEGAGTGGGAGSVYPPTPVQALVPPFDVPQKVRGRVIPVTFDVDSTGRVMSLDFPSTGDGGYNRRLRQAMQEYRFRPGVKGGVPVRATAVVTVTLPG